MIPASHGYAFASPTGGATTFLKRIFLQPNIRLAITRLITLAHDLNALGDVLATDLDDARGARRCLRGVAHASSSSARKSITRTFEPAAIVSTPGGMIARPFAFATVLIRLD